LVQKSAKRAKVILIDDNNDGENSKGETYNIDEMSSPPAEEEMEMKEFFEVLHAYFKCEVENPQCHPDKRKLADGICLFLKNVDSINVYNKKHWYLLMREFTGLNSKKITLYLKEFQKDYQRIRKAYLDGKL
jgi:hypothetical protein